MGFRNRLVAIVLFFSVSVIACAADTVIKAGQLLDPVSGKVQAARLIWIEDKKIKAVGGSDLLIPQDAKVIDLSGYTVLPGLMDAHTHLCWHINQRDKDDYVLSIVREPTPYRAIQGVMNARDMLMSGFTTVRDVGNAANYADSALRMAIEDELVPGPTMINAGRIISPFGGQRWVIPERRDFTQPEYFFADTQDEIKKAIRENIHFGATVIKLVSDDQKYQYSEEDIRYAVNEARLAGLRVAVHCATDICALNAIRAGARTVEHNMSEAGGLLAKKKGVWMVPTPFSLPALESMSRDLRQPPAKVYAKVVEGLKVLLRSGTSIAFGSDVISKMDGHTRGEAALTYIQSFVDAGATPLQIIQAMTVNAASAIDVAAERGLIQPGYYADIIAVPKNPMDDINVLKAVRFVMKEGVVYRFKSE